MAPGTPGNRRIKAIGHVAEVTEGVARAAGRLLAQTGSNATVDTLVIAGAARGGHAVVLTQDLEDLQALAAADPRITIQRV